MLPPLAGRVYKAMPDSGWFACERAFSCFRMSCSFSLCARADLFLICLSWPDVDHTYTPYRKFQDWVMQGARFWQVCRMWSLVCRLLFSRFSLFIVLVSTYGVVCQGTSNEACHRALGADSWKCVGFVLARLFLSVTHDLDANH